MYTNQPHAHAAKNILSLKKTTFAFCMLSLFLGFSAPAFSETRWNPPIPSIDSKNLLPNSSFELGTDGWSSLGKLTASGGDLCGLYGEIQTGGAFDGENCLKIELGPGKTLVTHSDYSLGDSQTMVQAAPLAANLGWMQVTEGKYYTLSAYMRSDVAGTPASLVFRFGGDVNGGFGSDTFSKRVALTQEWSRYSYTLEAYKPDLFIAAGPDLSATPEASATVWLDAVQLEEANAGSGEGGATQTEDFNDNSLDGIWGVTTAWNTEDTMQIADGVLTFHKTGTTGAGTAAVTNASWPLTGDFELEFTIPHLADFAQNDSVWVMPRFVVTQPTWTDVIWLNIGRYQDKYTVSDGVAGKFLANFPLSSEACIIRLTKTTGQMVLSVAVDGGAFSTPVIVGSSWASVSDTTEVMLYLLAQDWFSSVKGSYAVAIDDLKITADGIPGELITEPTEYAPRETVEIGINTEHYGNLYDTADPLELTVCGANKTSTLASVEIHAQLVDYFGVLWPSTSCTLEIPENALAETQLPLNAPGAGYYKAHVSWEVGGVAHTRTITLSNVKTYPWDDSPFGINHAPTTTAACQQLKKGGTTWARDWSMKWDTAEFVEGTYDFAEIDNQVNRIVDSGLNLLALLPPQPSVNWASEAPTSGLSQTERAAYAPPVADRPLLNNFIETTVNRYKDRVTHWEFLNEPLWVPWYCLPTSAGYTVDTYISLLQGASAAMKSGDSSCNVLGGLSIMAHSTMGDEFIQKGGLDYVDIYNLHPYPELIGPENFIPWMQRILGVMDANGGRKPIWATELSFWSTDDKPWTPWAPPNADHWSANRQQTSEREASDYNTRQAIILMAHGVEKFFWHSGLEGEVNNGSWDLEDPLLGREAVPQKYFTAQAALANLLGPSPTYAAALQKPSTVLSHSTSGVYGYAFDGESKAVLAAWAPGKYNDGKRRTSGVVPLGESPVYLTSTELNAQELSEACTLVRDTGPDVTFNGWKQLVSAQTSASNASPYGDSTVHIARALNGTGQVIWNTRNVPSDIDTGGTYSFTWLGATGYSSQPECTFALYLGATKLLDFTYSLGSTYWQSANGDYTLEYSVVETYSSGEDSAGFMTLTVPASMLTPGEAAQLKVVGSNSSSSRWFGVYAYDGSTPGDYGWALYIPDTVQAYTVVGAPMSTGGETLSPPMITTNNGQNFTIGVTPAHHRRNVRV